MAAATASPYLKQPAASGLGLGLGAFLLVVLGAASGALLAIGEMQALYLCLSIVATIAVLYDFRVGAVLLIVLLPVSASNLFPHELMGLRGLNPINLLVLATLGSYLLHGRIGHAGPFVPRPLLWLYLVPFLIAGLLGMRHAEDVFPFFYEVEAIHFTDALGYFRDLVVKPVLIAAVAPLIAAAVAKSHNPERFLIPIVAAVWAVCLLEIVFVIASGVHPSQLAGVGPARRFFLLIGMHANDLGRLLAMAYALLLFTWWEIKQPGFKLVLFVTLGLISIALLLTFSRGAFLGFFLVNALFVMWKFNARTLSLALLAGALVAVLAPGYLYSRVTLGFGSGDVEMLTAGRVGGIWLPLLPEIWKSPLWGNGIGSVMWSYPMLTEAMTPVVHPHNAYLESVLDVGFIGLGLFLAYYWTVWNGFRALGSHPYLSQGLRGFFQGASAGLLAFFVTGWAGSSLMPRYEWAFLWVAIGLMYGLLARGRTG
jgi:O-antigen ligase